ncbi:hypothetical protein Vafri_11206 [Volvox africanus]|nr:hypothetical protein Vafri_11206 [Volvox africanus]
MDGTLGPSAAKKLPKFITHDVGSFGFDVTDVTDATPANRWLKSLSVASQPSQPTAHGSVAAAVNVGIINLFTLTEATVMRRSEPSSEEPFRQQQQQQQHRQQQQQHRQVPKRAGWVRPRHPVPLLMIVYVFALAQSAPVSCIMSIKSMQPMARRLLQDEQQPPVLPHLAPQFSSQQPPAAHNQPLAPQIETPQADQPQLPKSEPPPPPSYIASASTSEEFFRLLYSGSDITEIRLLRDIKLLAADAIAAAAEIADVAADADVDLDLDPESEPSKADVAVAASAALGVGATRGPLLQRNLSIVGYSRGTHTRLDTNFLAAIIRLGRDVRLTLRKVELYKALNQLGQAIDIVGRSGGGVVELQDCVQRRAACVPLNLAVAQILSLPPAVDPQLRNRTPDVSLRNDSAFCWSTSTLLATCKQPSIDVQSVAVHVAVRDGVLADSGGYDVSYIDSHIVCDYQVEPSCLQLSSAEQCLARELVEHFGSDIVEPPPLEPAAAAAAAPAPAGQQGLSDDQRVAADGRESSRSRRMVVALAAGLAGGGGAALLLAFLFATVLIFRRRRWKDSAAGVDGKGGATAGGSGGQEGTSAPDTLDETVVQNPEPGVIAAGVTEAETSGTREERAVGCSAVGGGGAISNYSSREGNSSTHEAITSAASSRRAAAALPPKGPDSDAAAAVLAAAVMAEAPSDRGRLDQMDVEAIRQSLLSASRRYPWVPLQVQVLSLLGEGSFGKVYKGQWRRGEGGEGRGREGGHGRGKFDRRISNPDTATKRPYANTTHT